MSDPQTARSTHVWDGDVTWRRVAEMREVLFDEIDAHPDGLVLDVHQVTGIDRTGVALLIGANYRAHSLARSLTLLDDDGIVTAALARAHACDDFTMIRGTRHPGIPTPRSPGARPSKPATRKGSCARARPGRGHGAAAEYGQFGHGPEFTVGVEEEFMLVDADTLALVPAAPDLLRDMDDPEHVKPEVRESMVEISSEPHRATEDLYADLAALRRRLARAASLRGCRVAGGGTHPFSAAEDQAVTDSDRYQQVIAESGFPARCSVVFGTHIHVALGSADKAIQVTEALLDDLPTIVALSASSPVWSGLDTGLASTRLALWASVPRSGLPPRFDSYADYLACLASLRRSGAVPDASHVWWDIRTQDRLGTVELRMIDGQPRLRDAVAFAGLVQCLVHFHSRRWEEGVRAEPHRFLVTENRWAAIWHGMRAVFAHPNGDVTSARTAVGELLDRVAEDAQALGATWALEHLSGLADAGGPAARSRQVLSQSGDPHAVVRDLVMLTDPDTDAVRSGHETSSRASRRRR
jgi:carboxylate-amine ligase